MSFLLLCAALWVDGRFWYCVVLRFDRLFIRALRVDGVCLPLWAVIWADQLLHSAVCKQLETAVHTEGAHLLLHLKLHLWAAILNAKTTYWLPEHCFQQAKQHQWSSRSNNTIGSTWSNNSNESNRPNNTLDPTGPTTAVVQQVQQQDQIHLAQQQHLVQ